MPNNKANNSSGMMSWEQMWTYFKSDFCTDEQRKSTMKSLNIVDTLTVATADVQVEIMEHAPPELQKHPAVVNVLKMSALLRLGIMPKSWKEVQEMRK